MTCLSEIRALDPEVTEVRGEGVGDEEVAALAGRAGLLRIDLGRNERVTDEGLAALAGHPGLVWLCLDGCTGITDAGVASVSLIPSLESLLLSGCHQLGDAALEALVHLPRLAELFVSGAGFTDEGMDHLARCSALEILGLDGPIGDDGFRRIAVHPRLRQLHLPACLKITPGGVAALAGLPALELLAFYATPGLDDAFVPALLGLTRVEHLVLMRCGVSEDGLARLREGLPRCEVQG